MDQNSEIRRLAKENEELKEDLNSLTKLTEKLNKIQELERMLMAYADYFQLVVNELMAIHQYLN